MVISSIPSNVRLAIALPTPMPALAPLLRPEAHCPEVAHGVEILPAALVGEEKGTDVVVDVEVVDNCARVLDVVTEVEAVELTTTAKSFGIEAWKVSSLATVQSRDPEP